MNLSVNPMRLRQKMSELSLTNARLAETSGISESTIKRALNGAQMSSYTIETLAIAVNVNANWLTGDEPEIDPSEPPQRPEEPQTSDADMYLHSKIEAAYIERINDLKAVCEHTRKQLRIAVIIACVLVAFICVLFAYDIMNPTAGWIRR